MQLAAELGLPLRDLLWVVEFQPDVFATLVAYLEWRESVRR